MLRVRLFFAVIAAVALTWPEVAFGQLRADVFVTGLSSPIAFVQDPADAANQYVVEQGGRIRVVRNGALQTTDFLNLSSQISSGGERGLLGLAFAPDYATSGRFFVNFTNPSGHTVIARFKHSTANPLVADATTRLDLLWPDGNRFITQPFSNHNGGTLQFGPDGYLYIGMGDGGSGNDPDHNAQDPASLLGKMLRIDVNVTEANTKGYAIPADNPFLDGNPVTLRDGTPVTPRGEIWDFGLRNPWKFSFDDPAHGGTGALVIGDVGQSTFEEINYEPAGSGGRNYGWRNKEGTNNNVTNRQPAYQPLVDPIWEYGRSEGQSTTGGYVYRGSVLGPNFYGRYFFADFIAGRVWSLALTINQSTGEATASNLIEHTADFGGSSLGNVSSFGVDSNGELYIVSYSTGRVLRVAAPLPQMSLDLPAPGQAPQPFTVAGWAIDQGATTGTGVDTIHVWAHPAGGGSPLFAGVAAYGGARPDIGAAFGSRFTNSGFGLTVRGLPPGAYQLTAYAHSSVANAFNTARSVNLFVTNNLRTSVDVPAEGQSVGSRFTIAGWSIDLAAASGTGVNTLHVWAFPNTGGSPQFLGAVGYGGTRPDVGAIFGSQFTNSGYGLTASGLSPGGYRLAIYPYSVVTGGFGSPMNVNVVVQASTAMAVDTPAPGANVDSSFFIGGWAVDRDATSGSGVDAIHVWAYPVGGGAPQFVGTGQLGGNRPDIAALYGSQFANCGFGLIASGLSSGSYDVIVYAHSAVTGTFNNARVVRVRVN